MLSKRTTNPLIVVDEICKAQTITSNGAPRHAFADTLLSLVEPTTAVKWECPYFRVRFNMSHVSWVLTSNCIEDVPEPVRNRCQVIEIPDVTSGQLQAFARKKGAEASLSEDSVAAVLMTIALAPGVIGRLLSLRDVVQTLERAEVLEGRPRLQ